MRRAQTAGIAVAGVAVVGIGGYLLYRILKPTGDAAEKVGEAVGAIAGGVKDLAQGAAAITEAVKDTAQFGASFVDSTQGANKIAPKPGDFAVGRAQLRLSTYDKKDSSPGISKKTTVSFKVTRADTGQAVPYATITGVPHKAVNRRMLGDRIIRTCDDGGRYTGLEWTVVDLAGTDSEDDITFVATHPDFNPSPEVTVK